MSHGSSRRTSALRFPLLTWYAAFPLRCILPWWTLSYSSSALPYSVATIGQVFYYICSYKFLWKLIIIDDSLSLNSWILTDENGVITVLSPRQSNEGSKRSLWVQTDVLQCNLTDRLRTRRFAVEKWMLCIPCLTVFVMFSSFRCLLSKNMMSYLPKYDISFMRIWHHILMRL